MNRIFEWIKKVVLHPYTKFIVKKLLFYLVVIIVSMTFAFAIPRYMPGSPVEALLQPPPSGWPQEAIDDYLELQEFMIEQFGLDKPFWTQYLEFWGNLLRGDLGESFIHQMPVVEYMTPYIRFTLVLVIPVLIVSFVLGNWIGARTAYMKKRKGKFLYNFFIVTQSVPFYWLGLITYIILVAELKIFPSYGAVDPEYIPGSNIFLDILQYLWHYTAPFLVLLITQIGGWATGMRAMTLYEKDSEYLLYSQQLGFKQKLVRKYAKRNAILPQVTGLNSRLSGLIGQTIVIEAIFGWPGLGFMGLNALAQRDYPVIVGGFIITLIIVVIGNFILDITYGFIDPRIRTGART